MTSSQRRFNSSKSIIGLGTWLIAPFKTDIHTISLIIGISILATITFAGINTMIVMINQNKASSSIICLVVSLLMFGISFYVLSVLFSSDMAHSDSIVKQIYEFLNIFLPTGQLVLALNSFVNCTMFTPCCPRAGPTGGAGVALPAGICNLIYPVTCNKHGNRYNGL